MFSMVHKSPHANRKRMIAGVYSKTTLHSSPEIRKISQAIIMEHLLPVLEEAAKDGNTIDALELSFAVAMDFVTAYLFGLSNGSNFLQDEKSRQRWLAAHSRSKGKGRFWRAEFPNLTSFLSRLGINLVSPLVVSGIKEVKDLGLHMVRRMDSKPRGSTEEQSKPVVYEQLLYHLRPLSEKGPAREYPDSSYLSQLSIASELMDHMTAGTETSGWTVTYIMHELSQRPSLQTSLRKELLSLSPPIVYRPAPSSDRTASKASSVATEVPSPRAIDPLPLLDAVILETLRLHPAVAGSQPRITPSNPDSPVSLCGFDNIPPGIRVGAQAYSLHRNADVFPEPEVWKPDRWLQANYKQRVEMMRWLWAFGSGSYMCVGNHFAMLGQFHSTLLASAFSSHRFFSGATSKSNFIMV
jgi:hypothetical protein